MPRLLVLLTVATVVITAYTVVKIRSYQPEIRMDIEAEFEMGDIVYLKVRKDRERGMITGIMVRPGRISYAVSWGNAGETWHYAMELTKTFLNDYQLTNGE